jgi:thioesterase domain-containing protein/acyl carrier protein
VIEHDRLVAVLARFAPGFSGAITVDTVLTEDGLGLDSLALADLISGLEREFGVRIAEEDVGLETFGTVGDLLRFLRSRAGRPSHNLRHAEDASLFKALQPGRERAPFIMVNGDVFGDGALYCVNLVRRLGPERPFYSVSSHGTNGGRIPATIEAMAADHVHTLRAAVPDGPYLIGGFSHGALVAFEMARQLTASGCRVPLVVIIDMPPAQPGPQRHAHRSTTRVLLKRLRRAARHRLERLKRAAATVAPAGPTVAIPEHIDPRQSHRTPAWREAQWKTYQRIVRLYKAGPYPGAVTVMIARDGHYRERLSDATLGWRSVAGQVQTILVPGDHLTAVTRHTTTIARHLNRCFARIGC